jgi:hypothetical protein
MVTPERPDEEPEAIEVTAEEQPPLAPKGRRSLSRVTRELTEQELKSPGVLKLIIEDSERLERERGELVDYRDRFYAAREEVADLNARLKRSVAFEILSCACLVGGTAGMTCAKMLWEHQPAGWITLSSGAILIAAGIVAKAVKS